MNKQRKAAVLASLVGVVFIALEIAFTIATGLAGLFVMGMAAGLIIGDQMGRATSKPA